MTKKLFIICFLSLLVSLESVVFAQKIFKQVEKGNLKAVQNFLAKGGDINLKKQVISYDDTQKEYPEEINLLSYATYYGHKDILEILVENKSKIINYQEVINQALLKGSIKGELEICQFLLDEGAQLDANCTICHGRTPLQIAVGHEHWDLANFYWEEGANKKHIDNDGWNLLHLVACSNNTEWAKKVLKEGIDINQKNQKGLTPIMYAAGNGHQKMVDYLFKNGANIDLVDKEGDNLLMHAVHGGNPIIVKSIFETQKKYLNSKDILGNTPLSWAIAFGNLEVATFLIEQGADINEKIEGKSYLEYAKENSKDKELVNFIAEKISK